MPILNPNKETNGSWEVCIKGKPLSEVFEIAVVHSSNTHGKLSYGWFDHKKLLISHNGGPCRWPLTQWVWDEQVKLAHAYADNLNGKR